MTKRLQIILQDGEYREIQRTARAQNLTVAAWVCQALVLARRREPSGDVARKLDCVREAARHAFPTGDIGHMNGEIARGYRTSGEP
jgi:hypothetical protein